MSSNVTSDVQTALKKYNHSQGIVLDLRDNPGGLITQTQSLGSLFLSQGTIVSYSPKGESDVVLASNNSSPEIAPMTVLINRSTASAAEALAGALQDRNRAVIMGEQSYGKGTVQEVITLSDGSKLEITVGKFGTPSGRVIDQVGISPDLLVPETNEIQKALLVLQGLSALDKGASSSSAK
jgi:carboxyl-terminal processing protease